MQVDSSNLKHCARQIQLRTKYYKRTLHQSITLPYSSLVEPYFYQIFTFIVLDYKFCYPWIPIPVQKSSQASAGTRSRWRLETAQKRERHLDVLPLRDFGTKERESEGREVMLGTLLKLLVKDKLGTLLKLLVKDKLLQWKSTRERGAETRGERNGERKFSDTAL